MTLEERVTRLERQIDQLDRLEHELAGLRSDLGELRQDLRGAFERIFASLDQLNRKPGFHWPWERA